MSVKPLRASGYQKECSVQTALLNAFCDSGLQDTGKTTSPAAAAAGAASARAAERSGNSSSEPARTSVQRRVCFIALLPVADPLFASLGAVTLTRRLKQKL
jgi:hypothetical protein